MKGTKGRTGHFGLGVLAAVLGAAAAGCAGSAPAAQTQATVPETTLTSASSYAVPRHITAAYVQRVLNALEGIDARATAEIVRTHQFDDTAALDLRSTFDDAQFQTQTNSWLSQIDAGLTNYKYPPGPIHDRVVRVISGSSSCVFVSVVRDFSDVAVRPPTQHVSYIELTPSLRTNDPNHVNPTGWVIAVAGYNSGGGVPSDPCLSGSPS